MPDGLVQALQTGGLAWVALAYLVAGVVRGFTGFGTALIVVPVAGIYLHPTEILLMIGVSGLFSNLLLIPGAWGQADRGEVSVLALAALVATPVGVWAATRVDPTALRWGVALAATLTLAAVISGWQFRRRLGARGLAAVGGGAGLLGGMTALTGPVAIIFYLANARRAVAVRANMILFLAAMDIFLVVNILLGGWGEARIIWFACLVSVPYLASIMLGKALFDPAMERTYRLAAYVIVALAVLTGLPIWE